MRTDPKHKALVDAIVDSEMDAKELADKAATLGGALGSQLTVVSKNLAKRIIAGKLHIDEAEKMFREMYMLLTLKGFAYVAHDVAIIARQNEEAIASAAAALGKGVSSVVKIQRIDKAEREAERKVARGG